MNRYLFAISGHVEANAETEAEALEIIKAARTLTVVDDSKRVFAIIVPLDRLIHSEVAE